MKSEEQMKSEEHDGKSLVECHKEILKRVIMHILGETYVQHWYNYDDLCWQVRTKDFQQKLDIENFGNMEMLLKCLRERQEKHWEDKIKCKRKLKD